MIGVLGLDDFHPKAPRPRANGMVVPHANQMSATAHDTLPDGTHVLAPDDIATIYDITRLYQAGLDGTRQSVVVVGQSNINPADIADFRAMFSLSANVPQVLLVPGTQDTGITQGELEADLDIEWVGAVARNATIIYVYSSNFLDAVKYAISQNLAHIISTSIDICEEHVSLADEVSFRAQAQQANVQGITWVVSSGDAGAAACDAASPQATAGFAVYFPASIPEVTAVGGTEFADQSGNYWSTSNSPTYASALSYIPEIAWNDSGPNGLAASGGGFSVVYPQPHWQVGPGVPNVNFRAVPDVALAASANHDGYYAFEAGAAGFHGGTSASAPVFAGILALLNQFEGPNGQGNVNPNLYALAQSTMDVFHDITTGNNMVPCEVGSPDCTTGSFGYDAGPGYDLVTGLGSVDAYNLVTEWNSGTPDSQVIPFCTPNPVYQQPPDPQGDSWFYTINLIETPGVGTTLTGFTFNGNDYSSQIVSYFGSSTIPARGNVSVNLAAKGLQVPTGVLFGFTGKDAGGRVWSQQLLVPFNGPPPAQAPAVAAAVNGASFIGGGIVPGEISTIYGSNITGSSGINLTSSLPLPTQFLNDSVIINGLPVPLFAVDNVNGQQQFNFQVPWEVPVGSAAYVVVSNNGTTGSTFIAPVLAAQPGIFNYNGVATRSP